MTHEDLVFFCIKHEVEFKISPKVNDASNIIRVSLTDSTGLTVQTEATREVMLIRKNQRNFDPLKVLLLELKESFKHHGKG